jgi:uncharacterized membrane protein YgcG
LAVSQFLSSESGPLLTCSVPFVPTFIVHKNGELTLRPPSFLLTHLYQYFGALLGCTKYSTGVFSAYAGDPSMYKVHKFMDLGPAEMGYFIQQVALSGASFGVAQDDLQIVGQSLNAAFNLRCAPEAEIIPGQGAQLNSMCIADNCPLHPNATCAAYEDKGMAGGDMGSGNSTGGSSGTGGASLGVRKEGAWWIGAFVGFLVWLA